MHRSSNFAVPIFFMISGFYAYQADGITITIRLRKIFHITLFTVLIYILFRLLNMTNYDELYGAFTPYNIARAAIRLVLVSDLTFIYALHLWFLVSLIEGYIILLVIKRFNLWKAAYIYALLSFFALGIIHEKFGIWNHMHINVFTSGMCWIMTGHFIAENLQSVSQISRKILLASAVAGYLIGLLSLTGRMIFVSSVCFIFSPSRYSS